MLRRRRPFKYQEDTCSIQMAMPAAHKHDATPQRPFDLLADELLQYLFTFIPNHDLPMSVDKRFTANANEVRRTRAKAFFNVYLVNKLELKINDIQDLENILKAVVDYTNLCLLNDDSPIEKQTKFAVLLFIIMQVMEYMTKNAIREFKLLRNENMPLFVNLESGVEYINICTPINTNDLDTFKTEMLSRLEQTLKTADDNHAEPTLKTDIGANNDWLIKQTDLLKLALPDPTPFFYSPLISCGMWINPDYDKLPKLAKHALDVISNRLELFIETFNQERSIARCFINPSNL